MQICGEKKIKKIEFLQNKSLELSLFLSIPATFALMVSSEDNVISFGYGSFDVESVKNSANALFYFALGLPAFALIKVFSSFIFARQNTKIPFYFSVVSVTINILISVYFFNKIGFIIIPIATSLSSWLNAILLFVYLFKKNYFNFSKTFNMSFIKIVFNSILTSYLFYSLLQLFERSLNYESRFKLLCIILLVVFTIIVYLLLSSITKAFKLSDIKIKY